MFKHLLVTTNVKENAQFIRAPLSSFGLDNITYR